MADPLSVSASIIGILGFTTQVIKLLDDDVDSVKSAPEEARTLRTEIFAIQSALNNLESFLCTAVDTVTINFIDGCVLRSAIDECPRTSCDSTRFSEG
jgi:hypothetical protein